MKFSYIWKIESLYIHVYWLTAFGVKFLVPILWTNIWNHNTLIACYPRKFCPRVRSWFQHSSRTPLFDYIFIKCLSIDEIDERIEGLFRNRRIITPQNFNHSKRVVTQEIFKTLMNKISLRELRFHSATTSIRYIPRIPYTSYPGAIDCLRDLSELRCDSNVHSEFFCQLSRTCHRLQRFASC